MQQKGVHDQWPYSPLSSPHTQWDVLPMVNTGASSTSSTVIVITTMAD